MTIKYRIEDKEDIHHKGHKTRFSVYIYDDTAAAYIHAGKGMVSGWGALDSDCIAQWESDTQNYYDSEYGSP